MDFLTRIGVTLLLSLISFTSAYAGCSDLIGKVVFNEINHHNQACDYSYTHNAFIELRAIDKANIVDNGTYEDFTLTVCAVYPQVEDNRHKPRCYSSNAHVAAHNDEIAYEPEMNYGNAENSGNSWIVLYGDNGKIPKCYLDVNADQGGTSHGMELILYDANGDIIDYQLTDDMDDFRGVSSNSYLGDGGCTFTYDNYFDGANSFNVQRMPDGTGCWPDGNWDSDTCASTPTSPPSGNSATETTNTTNDVLPSGTTDVPLVVIDDITVVPGEGAVFTLSIYGYYNLSTEAIDTSRTTNEASSDIQITYMTIDGTASPPDYTAVENSINTYASFAPGASSTTITIPTGSSANIGDDFNVLLTGVISSEVAPAIIHDFFGIATFAETSSGGGGGSCVTFRDQFSTESYSRNDGSANWSSSWVETGDNGSATNGDIEINRGSLNLEGDGTGGSATFGGPSIEREADLSSYGTATLSFDYSESGSWEDTDFIDVWVSANGGGNWDKIISFNNDQGSSVKSYPPYDISAYMASNFRLAFVERANDRREIFYVDNVKIEACGTAAAGPDHYELSLPSEGISCTPSTVTVTACADNSSPCTNPATNLSGESATLATSVGSLGSTTVTFDATGTATTSLSFPTALDGSTINVTLSGETLSASNPRQCCPNGTSCSAANSCSLTAKTAGFIFSQTSSGSAIPSSPLLAETAGVNSATYYLRAVKSNTTTQACEALLTGTQSVDMSYSCADPATCSSGNYMSVAGTNFTGTSGTPSLTFDATGAAPFNFNFLDVGRIGFSASKANVGGTTLSGSSASAFVVKPYSLELSNIQQTSAPEKANPAATTATGDTFVKAGENFSATLTAVNASGSATPNFGQENTPETVTLTNALVAGLGLTNNPALNNPEVSGFTNGVASRSDFSWDEVGIITLTPGLTDDDYLGAGSVTGTTSSNVGRFYADHFTASLSAANFAPADSNFSYLGQAFKYATAPNLAITAYSLNNIQLLNYENNFWKLGSGITTPAGTGPSTFLYGDNAIAGATLQAPASDISFGDTTDANGTRNLVVHDLQEFQYLRPAAPIAPFDADVSLQVTLLDSDGASGSATLNNIGFNNDSDAGPFNTTNDQTLRFGRATLTDSYGRETEGQQLTLWTQYYDGNDFILNGDDTGTTYSVAPADPSTPPTLTNPACSDPDVDDVQCSQVSVGGTAVGHGNVFTLSAPGAGNTGTLQYTLSVDSWLLGDWDGNGSYAENPTATATFGVYRSDDRFHYWREER